MIVVLCVSFFSFFLLQLVPGDPVTSIVGFSSPADHKLIAHELHLDRGAISSFGVSNWTLPRIEEAYLTEKVEPGLFPLMGKAGLLGVTVPERYGGRTSLRDHQRPAGGLSYPQTRGIIHVYD